MTSTLTAPAGVGADALPPAARRPPVPAAWFAMTAGVLAGLAPLLLLAATPLSAASSDAWQWAWLLTVVVGLRYGWLVAEGSRRLYELIFWLFTYVFLGLAPLAQMRAGRSPGTTPDLDPRLNGAAMLVVFVGSLAFSLGVALAGRRPQRPVPGHDAGVATHRLVILTALAVLLAAYYTSKVGVGTLFSSRAHRTGVEGTVWPDATVQAVVKALATLPLIVAHVGLVRLRDQRRWVGRAGLTMLPLVVLVVLVVVVNPVTSPRYVFGTALLALLTGLGVTSTARRTRLLALLLAAGLVLVFPYADATRRSTTDNQLSAGPAKTLSSSDFDAFDQINNMVAYVRDEGNAHGRQLAGAALFFVPRSVWKDKPRDTGIVVADYRDYSFKNLSAPLVGELYLNGGWSLLVGGMALFGFGVRRLDARGVAGRGRAPGRGVLASVLPFYLIIVLRGSLLQSMAGLAVIVASAAFIGDRRRTRT